MKRFKALKVTTSSTDSRRSKEDSVKRARLHYDKCRIITLSTHRNMYVCVRIVTHGKRTRYATDLCGGNVAIGTSIAAVSIWQTLISFQRTVKNKKGHWRISVVSFSTAIAVAKKTTVIKKTHPSLSKDVGAGMALSTQRLAAKRQYSAARDIRLTTGPQSNTYT